MHLCEFFPLPYATTCAEFVMALVLGKIILNTIECYGACISVIDAGLRLGGVWQAVVLFWDPLCPGFLHMLIVQ